VKVTPQAGRTIGGDTLVTLLQRIEEYRAHARKLVSRGIPREALDILFSEGIFDKSALGESDKLGALETALKNAGFDGVRQLTEEETETPFVRFLSSRNGSSRQIVINGEFLSQYDFRQMGKAFAQLAGFGLPPYALEHGGDTTALPTADSLIEQVYELGKKGLSISRYKGLGEMNPEQLWDTTMNPEQRLMLQVTLEDAAQADERFAQAVAEVAAPGATVWVHDYQLQLVPAMIRAPAAPGADRRWRGSGGGLHHPHGRSG